MSIFSFMKSTRSIAVVVFSIGVHIALFLRIVSPEVYGQALMLVIGAYFAKRDSEEERGQ